MSPNTSQQNAKNPLTPCVYIVLRCPDCGEFRLALATLPNSSEVGCPVCNRACAFAVLGSGLTKTQLPFHEIPPAERIRWTIRVPALTDCS